VATGTTTVQVLLNGQVVLALAATVVAPPATSLPPTLDAGAWVALQNPAPPADADAATAAVDATVLDATATDGADGDDGDDASDSAPSEPGPADGGVTDALALDAAPVSD
jgi:hypothetical protein